MTILRGYSQKRSKFKIPSDKYLLFIEELSLVNYISGKNCITIINY